MSYYNEYGRGTHWAGGRMRSGPKPQATKRWHKVVLDIVTVLVVVGLLAWFVCSLP